MITIVFVRMFIFVRSARRKESRQDFVYRVGMRVMARVERKVWWSCTRNGTFTVS